MKTALKVTAVVVAAIAFQVGLALALRGWVLRQAVGLALSLVTGCPCSVASVRVDPFRNTITLRDAVVGQPPGFPPGEFIHVREFYVVLPPAQPTNAEFLVREMRVDIPVITVVVNDHGDINVETLQKSLGVEVKSPTLSGGVEGTREADALVERFVENPEAGVGRLAPAGSADAPESPAAEAQVAPPPTRATRIEKLDLVLGETVTRTSDGQERRTPLGLRKTYENVTDMDVVEEDLQKEILIRAAASALGDALKDDGAADLMRSLESAADDLLKSP